MYLNELKNVSVDNLNFITKKQKDSLIKNDIPTVYDIINYFPFRYDDRTKIVSIEESLIKKINANCIIEVEDIEYIFYNGKKHPKIIIKDDKLRASLVCFNRSYITNVVKIGKKYWINAIFEYSYSEIKTSNFDIEEYIENVKPKKFLKINPIYRQSGDLTNLMIKSIVSKVLDNYLEKLEEDLPSYLIKGHNLISKKESIKNIHFPEDENLLKLAKLRIAFEEFFIIQVAVLIRKKSYENNIKNHKYKTKEFMNNFINNLEFKLTNAQKKAIDEIISDMDRNIPMHRLLQGDVGSGKTIVAIIASIYACSNGYQVAMMVPTEVLANQHYQNIKRLVNDTIIKPVLLTGSLSIKDKNEIKQKIKDNEYNLIIGTHALYQEDIEFNNLSLIVIDEQHKFGVLQRIALAKKANKPDLLVMTATPIPRTLTLTLYGDLDISIIDEMPSGRKPVETRIIFEEDYLKLIDFIRKQIENNKQIYFVCPLIEESEKINYKNIYEVKAKLSKYFDEDIIGILHGKLDVDERNRVINDFLTNKIKILVSTTVIEVGIDIKNANVIVIEGADRFGLSQIHQLRGRVGRGTDKSYCFLIPSKNCDDEALQRLKVIVNSNDGFKIAEEDLRLRGPGEILGERQTGMPELKIADYLRDMKLLQIAKKDAEYLLNSNESLVKKYYELLYKAHLSYLPEGFLISG